MLITLIAVVFTFKIGIITCRDPWEAYYGGRLTGRTMNTSWCYTKSDCGPEKWTSLCRDGKFQSPIDLDLRSSDVTSILQMVPYLVTDANYKEDILNFQMTNNGHSLVVVLNDNYTSDKRFTITDLNQQYTFSQLHFHWATKNEEGSEHTLDKKRFPMEIHLIHYKTSLKSLELALKSGDPVAAAVLAVFAEVNIAGEEDNLTIEAITDAIVNHKYRESSGTINEETIINLTELLPKQFTFFRYRGSLTTPPCTERVQWIVFDDPIHITRQQLAIFRRLETKHEKNYRIQNYRSVQELNGRKIEYFE